jgi:hypothetical protein
MEQPEWPEREAGRTSSGPTPPAEAARGATLDERVPEEPRRSPRRAIARRAHDGDAERPVPVDRRVVQPPTAVTSVARRTARLNAGRCCRRGPMEVDSLRSRLIPERLKEREAVHTSSR